MKICMYIWNFRPGPQGGAERQCWKLAREMVRQGHECTVLTRRSTWRAARHEVIDGVQIRRVGLFGPVYEAARTLRRLIKPDETVPDEPDYAEPQPYRYGLLSPFRFLECLFFMAGSCVFFGRHQRSMDVVHVHETGWMAGFSLMCCRKWNIPVLVKETIFPVFPAVYKDTPFYKKWDHLRRTADAYVAVHDEIRESLQAEISSFSQVYVVPNGVEIPEQIAALDSQQVLMVANLEQGAAHKAFDVMLQAWALVIRRHPQAMLTVAGRGDSAWWQQMAGELGCASRVCFPGPVTEIDRCYKEASIFVLPSRKEGLSNALLEAQSWGIPAVVSDIPGNRTVIQHGTTGVICPVGNPELLAEGICAYLDDAELRRRVGGAARRKMEEEFSIKAVCDKITVIYQELISGCGQGITRTWHGSDAL